MTLSPCVIVGRRSDGERAIFANADVEPGTVLLTYDGPILDHATRYSIQIGEHEHVEGTEDSNAALNHSCAANAFVDWGNLCLRAGRRITRGEEVTCNYLTTDDVLAEPFLCRCGAPDCVGEVRGFRYLAPERQLLLAPLLPPFLKQRLAGDSALDRPG